jgi:hypothetical protein
MLKFRDQFWSQAEGQIRFDPSLERRQPLPLELVSYAGSKGLIT